MLKANDFNKVLTTYIDYNDCHIDDRFKYFGKRIVNSLYDQYKKDSKNIFTACTSANMYLMSIFTDGKISNTEYIILCRVMFSINNLWLLDIIV